MVMIAAVASSTIIVAAAFVICGVNTDSFFDGNSQDWPTGEVRGRGTSPGGEYSDNNCSGQDCQDADEETEQEEQVQDEYEEEQEQEEEEEEPRIRFVI
jgi:hypothetical protein